MEIRRINAFALVVFIAIEVTTSLFGSGDWGDEQPPTTLDAYLDRLPAKSVGRIFEESARNKKWGPTPNVSAELRKLLTKIKTTSPEKLVEEVDQLLVTSRMVRAREQAPASEDPQLPAKDLNLLHDIRDALIGSGSNAADYIGWRIDHDVLIQAVSKTDSYDREPPILPKTVVADVEKRATEAQGSIRAQWLYVRGALAFHYGAKADAQSWFEKVISEFPAHPRAESALFMKGRCELSESRSADYDFDKRINNNTVHTAAIDTFLKYIEQYPQGRFIADAKGWLGGLAWDEEDYLGSLNWYIKQAETPDHPEVLKSAVLMMEKNLRRLAASKSSDQQENAFALVAAHPKVAMGMLYLILGSPDAAFQYPRLGTDAETQQMRTEKIRNWRRTLLPRLASAVANQKDAYTTESWQPRYLALLIHAASNAGKYEEALKLVDRAEKPEENDDLLFAKAIALQRAGKTSGAISTFRLLLKDPPPFRTAEQQIHFCGFPDSVLTNGARIRLAIALRDNHQAGLAILELKKLEKQTTSEQGVDVSRTFPADHRLNFTDTGIYSDLSNAQPEMIRQLTDTLLNFAPLAELAAALDVREIEPCLVSDLREVIAKRALAREDFKTAQRMMPAAEFERTAATLERLITESQQPKLKASEKAVRELRVGDAWAALHGHLLTNSNDLQRRSNARTLGFKDADDEMEENDELIHAWHWWLKAARTAPGTSTSASARLKVLQAMAQLAKGSDYFLTRATEEDWSGASRKIYDRLQTESSHSSEAAQAVWWAFELPGKDAGWHDTFGFSQGESSADDFRRAGYWWSDYGAFDIKAATADDGRDVARELSALRNTTLDLPALAQIVAKLRRDAESVSNVANLNCLDDLALCLAEPGLTAETIRAYINLRLDVLARTSWGYSPGVASAFGIPQGTDPDTVVRKRIANALKDPQFKAVRDYIEFLDAAMVANHQIRPSSDEEDKNVSFAKPLRDYQGLERMMRDFLKRYPHSKKREAARLLLARAVYRQSWPRYQVDLPGMNVLGDARLCYQQEPFNAKRVFAPLDDYDKEFPNGRYAADICNMRACVLWRLNDWLGALKLTLAQLDQGGPDLQQEGAFRIANLFAELAKPEHRAGLIAAIKETPGASEQLKLYLAKAPNYRDHPLRFLGGYLQDQLEGRQAK